MPNVIAFTPRPRASQPPAPPPLPVLDLRTHLEGAAQTALDAADAIIAALDRLDGSEGADASVTALATHAGQVVELREPPAPVETEPAPTPVPQEAPPAEPETPETALEEIAAPAPAPEPIILPWRGAGNVVSAAGCAVLALVGMRA